MDSEAGFQKADRLGAFFTSLPKWIAIGVIAWQARLAIAALASRGAAASVLTRFGRETSFWELVCWIAGILGILFGLYNRYLLSRYRSVKSTDSPRGE